MQMGLMRAHAKLWVEKLKTRHLHAYTIKTRIELATEEIKGIQKGNYLIDAVQDVLRKLDKISQRSTSQIKTHTTILGCAARYFYGDSYKQNEAYIKKRNRFPSLKTGYLLSAPRRNGKTVTIIYMIVALLIVCPNINIIAVSGNINAAGKESGILGKVARYMVALGVNKRSFQSDNSKHLVYRITDNDIRGLHSFSGGSGDK